MTAPTAAAPAPPGEPADANLANRFPAARPVPSAEAGAQFEAPDSAGVWLDAAEQGAPAGPGPDAASGAFVRDEFDLATPAATAAAMLERLATRVRAGEIDLSSVTPEATDAAMLASILAALLGGASSR
jgi:hypothetical protein